MAIAFLKHTPIGKKTQAQPGTAAAHIRYISRSGATVQVFAQRMPSNYWAAQRFMDDREASIRANGRVCDKLTLALPREMTQEQGVELVRAFADRLSTRYDEKEGRWLRAPYYFTLQGWDERHPHCHFVFVDADTESGRRVFGTSELRSTERIKELWQDTTNLELARHGIEGTIAFPDADACVQLQTAPEAEEVQGPPPEVDMEPANDDAPAIRRIEDALWYTRELSTLNNIVAEREKARETVARYRDEAARLMQETSSLHVTAMAQEQALEVARERLATFTRSNGQLRGFEIAPTVMGVKLFEWQSPTRQKAIQARQMESRAELYHQETATKLAHTEAMKEHALSNMEFEAAAARQRDEEIAIERSINIYGMDETLSKAQETLAGEKARTLHELGQDGQARILILDALAADDITYGDARELAVELHDQWLINYVDQAQEQQKDMGLEI
ncbi:MAG: hypothetical protein IKE42_28230 [Aquamicrobium sp.]|nr:hypothetical protein [Aquamicrobium sp.]